MSVAKRMITFLIAITLVVNLYGTSVFAKDTADTFLMPTTGEMLLDLEQASQALVNGTISIQEYDAMILDIYQITSINDECLNERVARSSSDYYPETQIGYINHDGVVYLYNYGLRNASTASAAISFLISALPGAGWGLGAISVACAFGGKSLLESAVNQAYYSGKGIYVYYKIHKSITSLNKIRYVVG